MYINCALIENNNYFFIIAVQLIYVAIIGEVLILMFSVIAFAFLHEYFETQNNLFCSTLWECFVTVTYEGWLSTIGAVSINAFPLSFCIRYHVRINVIGCT